MKKALIIRHAHREKMPSELGQYVDGFQENHVLVTEEGRLVAKNVGKVISAQYDFVTFSSVLRCNQTAAYINSQNTLKNIGESEYLVSEYFGNLNQLNEKEKQIVIDSLLNREDSLGLDLHKKMESIMNYFKANTKLGNGIYVTHDWWMALFLSYFTELFKQDGYNIWPDFLEYFEIDFEKNEIIYRNMVLKLYINSNH
jgi:broad specificity phosphatase PhoE